MKIKILFALFLLIPFYMQAQVTLTTQLPAAGILSKDQLWNVVIANNSDQLITVRLEVDVTGLQLGQSVLNASTGKMFIPKGVRQLSMRDVQPITYNYISTEFTGNYAPCGQYNIHYLLIQEIPGKGDIHIADEIIRMNVTPVSPALLSSPSDQSGIETVYPQFAWLAPTPIEMFNPLLYDINVVQIEEGQTAREAIEYNKSVYFNTNISFPAEKMASSYEQLKQGKNYAWQIIARSGMQCTSPSEIWTFTIGKDSINTLIDAAPFVKLSQSNTELAIAQESVIKMEYLNNTADNEIKCILYKAADKEKKGRKTIRFNMEVQAGQNFLTYNKNRKIKLSEKTVYEISITNGRGEVWYMRFTAVYFKKTNSLSADK